MEVEVEVEHVGDDGTLLDFSSERGRFGRAGTGGGSG